MRCTNIDNALFFLGNIFHGSPRPPVAINAKTYVDAVNFVYGSDKVQKVSFRYGLFQKILAKASHANATLNFRDVRELQCGLNDVSMHDLELFLKKIKANDSLTKRERDVVEKIGEEKKNLIAKADSVSTLPSLLFNELIEAFRLPNELYRAMESAMEVKLDKISPLPKNYVQHGWISFQSGRSGEDEERLTLYKELESLGPTEVQRYSEILSKILVKKHLYYEQEGSNKLLMGMLVPGLKSSTGEPRWYRIEGMIDSGLGKLAYHLVPATTHYSSGMPDIILYRSSATLPTAKDCFTSYLSDCSILPPGYLSRNSQKDVEVAWMANASPTLDGKTRPLIVMGHSLGGSNCQVGLMNLRESGQWPDREISVEIFDSPAISAKDAREFAKWANNSGNIKQNMQFNYYDSKGDPIPLAGSVFASSYLGNFIDHPKVVSVVHKMQLTKEGKKIQAVAGLGAHGRCYFRGRRNVDYCDDSMTISEFDRLVKKKRRVMVIPRVAFAPLVWGTIGIGGLLKRTLVGRREYARRIRSNS